MADLGAVLRKTIDGLPNATPQLRAKVYEKARAAIVRQIEAANPPLPDGVAEARLTALEEAIGETEDHYLALEAAPSEPEPAPKPKPKPKPEPEPEPQDVPVVPAPIVEPRTAAPPPPAAPVRRPVPSHDEPVSTPAPPPMPRSPNPVAPARAEPAAEASRPAGAPPSWAARHPESRPEPADDAGWNETRVPEGRSTSREYQPADPYEPTGPYEDRDEPDSGVAVFDTEPEEPENYLPESHPYAVSGMENRYPSEAYEAEPEDRDEVYDDEDDDVYRSEGIPPADMEGPRAVRRSSARGLMVGLVVVLLLIGAGAAAWVTRDLWQGYLIDSDQRPQEVATGTPPQAAPNVVPSTPTPSEEPADEPAPMVPPPPSEPAAPEAETDSAPQAEPSTDVAAVETPQPQPDSNRRFTQRLLPDGTEVDEGPAVDSSNAFDEGTNIAAASPEPLVEPVPGLAATPAAPEPSQTEEPAEVKPDPDEADEAEEAPAATAAVQPSTGPQAQAVPVAQQVMFYEERSESAPATQHSGQVVWSLVQEASDDGGKTEPAIRAVADVPEENIKMTMMIRRNTDVTLPASHVIELTFDVPSDFAGGQIANVQRLALKPTEQSRGEPLVGVAGKISDGFFIIALNDLDEAIETNLQLLKNQEWIDIPLAYSNGRRALISVEKGIPGDRVFSQALDAWAAKT
ncbi:hypothetical protein [Consotaella aegiceratis]|uniref:hypothetical protein n=1 Tax=Consotaella aegiceratis TaxID=3097961 RepID=UPI002F42D46E